jgi:hypothetical protein
MYESFLDCRIAVAANSHESSSFARPSLNFAGLRSEVQSCSDA